MRMARLLVLTLAAASLALTHGAVAATTSSAAESTDTPLISAAFERTYFSPNNDGRTDRAQGSFELAKGASVKVVIKRQARSKVLHRERLGTLPAGPHVWHWDGKRGNGKAFADATYDVIITARRGGRTERATTVVEIDTDGTGRLVATRSTVYPLATAVQDHIAFTYVTRAYHPETEEHTYTGVQARTRLSIHDLDFKTVWKSFRKDEYAPRFTWDGTDRTGAALPAGKYVAMLRTVDTAGNKDMESLPLTISHQQLEQRTWSTTVPAAEAEAYTPYAHCMGCGEGVRPVPSDRFPGGLSFRPVDSSGASRSFTITPPFTAAPVDTYRVTTSGGPMTPGGTGSASLYTTAGPTAAPLGDGTTTSPWGPVRLTGFPFLPAGNQGVSWTFDGRSYDIATFTVEYRYYAPVG